MKLVPIFLAIVVGVFALSGCGNKESDADQPKVKGTVPVKEMPPGTKAPGDVRPGPKRDDSG